MTSSRRAAAAARAQARPRRYRPLSPYQRTPIRGMSAVVAGAGPAHACFFATYEQSKHTLGHLTRHRHDHITHGLSGCLASLVHDAVSNPAEALTTAEHPYVNSKGHNSFALASLTVFLVSCVSVVKQRLQMLHSPYRGVWECARRIYRAEGLRAFYRSYGTQVAMNVPFQAVHFVTYEWCQARVNPTRAYDPAAHALSGGLAGALAAAATTPLDVCKTALNTQEATADGLAQAAALVLRTSGLKGFFRGLHARVLYQMPAAAICWLTYETFKHILAKTEGGGGDGIAKDRTAGISNVGNVGNVSGVGGVGSVGGVGPPLACAALRLAAEVPPPSLTRS
ncbi:Mitoferrin-1 [Papilio xuthus]|uniref:Mitoferrin-1 n=1 Tax=Papilio xuthus TaxID=66420 RepID=A0A0N1IN49_PAPXU|nr:Mitoferrin-1 [Papilio xuthus]